MLQVGVANVDCDRCIWQLVLNGCVDHVMELMS